MHRKIIALDKRQIVQIEPPDFAGRSAHIDGVDQDQPSRSDGAEHQCEQHCACRSTNVEQTSSLGQGPKPSPLQIGHYCRPEAVVPEKGVAAAQHQHGLAAILRGEPVWI